jgi:hypothetical protein
LWYNSWWYNGGIRYNSGFCFVSLHSEASEACDSGGRLRHAMQKHETETGNEDHTTLRILHFSDAMKQIKP